MPVQQRRKKKDAKEADEAEFQVLEDSIVDLGPHQQSSVGAEALLALLTDDDITAEVMASISGLPQYSAWSPARLQRRAGEYVQLYRCNAHELALADRSLPVVSLARSTDLPDVLNWVQAWKAGAAQGHGGDDDRVLRLLHSPYTVVSHPSPASALAQIRSSPPSSFVTVLDARTLRDVRIDPAIDPFALTGRALLPLPLEGPFEKKNNNTPRQLLDKGGVVSPASAWPTMAAWAAAAPAQALASPVALCSFLGVDALTQAANLVLQRQQAAEQLTAAGDPIQEAASRGESSFLGRPRRAAAAIRPPPTAPFSASGLRDPLLVVVVDDYFGSDAALIQASSALSSNTGTTSFETAIADLGLDEDDVVEGCLHDLLRALGYVNVTPDACIQLVASARARIKALVASQKEQLQQQRLASSAAVQRIALVTLAAGLVVQIQTTLPRPRLLRRQGHTLYGPPLMPTDEASDGGGLLSLLASVTALPLEVLHAEVRAIMTPAHMDELDRVRLALGSMLPGQQQEEEEDDRDKVEEAPASGAAALVPHHPMRFNHRMQEQQPRRPHQHLRHLVPPAGGRKATAPCSPRPQPPATRTQHQQHPDLLVRTLNASNPGLKLPEGKERLLALQQSLLKAAQQQAEWVVHAEPDDVIWFLTRVLPVACQRAVSPPPAVETRGKRTAPRHSVWQYLDEHVLSQATKAGLGRVLSTMCNEVQGAYRQAASAATDVEGAAAVAACHVLLILRRIRDLDPQLHDLLSLEAHRRMQRDEVALQDQYNDAREQEKQKLLRSMAGLDLVTRQVVRQLRERGVPMEALELHTPAADPEEDADEDAGRQEAEALIRALTRGHHTPSPGHLDIDEEEDATPTADD